MTKIIYNLSMYVWKTATLVFLFYLTHVNRWAHIIASQNGSSIDYIFSYKSRALYEVATYFI